MIEAGGTTRLPPERCFKRLRSASRSPRWQPWRLLHRGRLSLDEDVNLKLKSWLVPDNEFTKDQKVTLRRLLNHSAGFNVEDVGSYATGEAMPTLVQALDGRTPARSVPIRVDMVPGTGWRYCSRRRVQCDPAIAH